MAEKDRISSIFWLFLSLGILKESWGLPFGSLSRPMHGFFPFTVGTVLGLLSLAYLLKSWLGRKKEEEGFKFFPVSGGSKRIGLTLGSLLVFYLLLESAGFLIAAFFLIFVLIRFVEPQKWFYSVAIAVLISLSSYLLFQVVLKSNLPMGILEGLGF